MRAAASPNAYSEHNKRTECYYNYHKHLAHIKVGVISSSRARPLDTTLTCNYRCSATSVEFAIGMYPIKVLEERDMYLYKRPTC